MPTLRRSFASTVNSHKRLEKVKVREFLRFRTEFAHGQGLLESALDFRFVVFLYPGENDVDIALREGLLSSFYHRAI